MQTIYLVTPSYNAVRTIDETIWSVVSQVGDIQIRYHVQDGGSQDGTQQKLERWDMRIKQGSMLLPARVEFTWASISDRGMYDAISKGFEFLRIAEDAFMSWINADDALWPGALQAIANLAGEHPTVDWIMGWITAFDNNGRVTHIQRNPHYASDLIAGGLADGIHWPFVQQESTFWRRRLWDAVGGISSDMCFAGDWDLWRRFAGVAKLCHVNRQLGGFWVRPNQKSQNMDSYRAEIAQIAPLSERRNRFRALLSSGDILAPIPTLVQTEDGVWLKGEREAEIRAKMAAKLYKGLSWIPCAERQLLHRMWGVK